MAANDLAGGGGSGGFDNIDGDQGPSAADGAYAVSPQQRAPPSDPSTDSDSSGVGADNNDGGGDQTFVPAKRRRKRKLAFGVYQCGACRQPLQETETHVYFGACGCAFHLVPCADSHIRSGSRQCLVEEHRGADASHLDFGDAYLPPDYEGALLRERKRRAAVKVSRRSLSSVSGQSTDLFEALESEQAALLFDEAAAGSGGAGAGGGALDRLGVSATREQFSYLGLGGGEWFECIRRKQALPCEGDGSVAPEYLRRMGIDISTFLEGGYPLSFVCSANMWPGLSFAALLDMNFTLAAWIQHPDMCQAPFLLEHFGESLRLEHFPDFTLHNLITWIDVHAIAPSILARLGWNYQRLGLSALRVGPHNIHLFRYSLDQWAGDLGLTYQEFLELDMNRNDLERCGWQDEDVYAIFKMVQTL